MEQLYQLSRPFPESLVKQKPGKFAAAFVEHGVIVQRLLEVCGPYSFTVDRPVTNADGTVVGCLATLEVTVDGQCVRITEVGDVEHPSPNNGSNLKNAASDSLKRCAMRLGVGLHLWSQENYYLEKALAKRIEVENERAADSVHADGESVARTADAGARARADVGRATSGEPEPAPVRENSRRSAGS